MYVGTWVASRGFEPERLSESAHPSMVPFQNFPTADGWIVVACPKQKFWERLCEALGRSDLAADPRFADFAGRNDHRDVLVPELRRTFLTRTTEEWLEVLTAAEVPNARVNDVAEALADPQVHARAAWSRSSTHDSARCARWPRRSASATRRSRRGARPCGARTPSACSSSFCGYTRERVRELAAAGAFG